MYCSYYHILWKDHETWSVIIKDICFYSNRKFSRKFKICQQHSLKVNLTIIKSSCHLSPIFWLSRAHMHTPVAKMSLWNICNAFLLLPKTRPRRVEFSKDNSIPQISGISEINSSSGILNTSQKAEGSNLLLIYWESQINNATFQPFQLITDLCSCLLYCNKITDLFVSFENSESLFLKFPKSA